MTTHAIATSGTPVSPDVADGRAGTPGWLDTYAITYAFGILWLAAAIATLGTMKNLSFDAVYDLVLFLPPFVTALCVLLVDRTGSWRTLPWRWLLLAGVAGVTSVISTVLLTPLLVVMFRGGVGRDPRLAGLISAASLVVVAAPMVPSLLGSLRGRRWVRVPVLVAGLAVAALALVMALTPGGPLAAALRLDQAEITMITVSWWLPFYAAAAAFARRIGMA